MSRSGITVRFLMKGCDFFFKFRPQLQYVLDRLHILGLGQRPARSCASGIRRLEFRSGLCDFDLVRAIDGSIQITAGRSAEG